MPYGNVILSYFLVCCVFFFIDIIWLGFVAKGLYGKYLQNFLAPEVNWVAAGVFYFLFIIGLFIFVIYPAVAQDSWMHALMYGALFGFFTYATYDLTNLATLKDWPLEIVLIDIVWGMALCASVCVVGFYIVRYIG